MYYYIILCRVAGGSNAAAARLHFIRYTTVRDFIPFHSISFATLPFAISFHFIR
jgi:hypothetical protein